MLRCTNLSLLILYPITWVAPLLNAGLLSLFGLIEISEMSGLQSLWEKDVLLALVVTVFALLAPYAKTISLALLNWNLLNQKLLQALHILGKLAMADIFLIALYVTLSKGIRIGRIETAWGLYLFTACIFASLLVSLCNKQSEPKVID
jgi:paraquat-inducible protein A